MVTPDIPEIVGLQEIAPLLDVNSRTPHAWKHRRLLPPSDGPVVNGLQTWRGATILAWAARTGRLPPRLSFVATSLGVTVPEHRGGREAKAENLAALAVA